MIRVMTWTNTIRHLALSTVATSAELVADDVGVVDAAAAAAPVAV